MRFRAVADALLTKADEVGEVGVGEEERYGRGDQELATMVKRQGQI